MRHRHNTKTFSRKKAPREMMFRNLASSILIYERVETTLAKAKAVRPLVEKMISLGKKGDLASTKKLIRVLPQKNAVEKTGEVFKDRYANRPGGYTRIIKTGHRVGDGAPTAVIELVK